jgi:uncharacterized protein YbjT (DUF2867 family)
MQQGRFRATGMMIHHPQVLPRSSVAILVTRQLGHFWKADPGHFSKAPKFIHPDDIAAVSVAALLSDACIDCALPITGPDSLTFAEATNAIREAIGRRLSYELISDEEARERYSRISGSAEEAEAHVDLWRAIREGRLGATTDEVERVLGRKALSVERWASENADAFLSSEP